MLVVARFEADELHGEVVAQPQARGLTEVGESFSFFLRHVVSVRAVDPCDRSPPGESSNLVPRHLRDRITNLVVVLDGVERFVLDAGRMAASQADADERGIKRLFFARRVQLEERRQARPNGRQGRLVRVIDLFEDRKQPALLAMIVKYQLCDVHLVSPVRLSNRDKHATAAVKGHHANAYARTLAAARRNRWKCMTFSGSCGGE